jgi:hypothetical protein
VSGSGKFISAATCNVQRRMLWRHLQRLTAISLEAAFERFPISRVVSSTCRTGLQGTFLPQLRYVLQGAFQIMCLANKSETHCDAVLFTHSLHILDESSRLSHAHDEYPGGHWVECSGVSHFDSGEQTGNAVKSRARTDSRRLVQHQNSRDYGLQLEISCVEHCLKAPCRIIGMG